VRPDTTTLKLLLDMGVENHMPAIQNISDVAEKEYKFEFALEKMRGEWHNFEFEISPYKDTGTYVVKGVDEVVSLLDDQIVKVQGMRGSPYAKGALGTIVVEWNNRLLYMQEALDELLKVWGLGFGVWGLGFGVWGLGAELLEGCRPRCTCLLHLRPKLHTMAAVHGCGYTCGDGTELWECVYVVHVSLM
jgi:hypothetical protein